MWREGDRVLHVRHHAQAARPYGTDGMTIRAIGYDYGADSRNSGARAPRTRREDP